MRFPILVTALVVGLLAGLSLPSAGVWLCAPGAAAAAALLRWRGLWGTPTCLVVVALGVMAGSRAGQGPARDAPLGAALAVSRSVTVLARIRAGPDETSLDDGTKNQPRSGCVLWLDIDELDGVAAEGGVRLTIARGVLSALPGDQIRFTTSLGVPRGFANPGAIDMRLWAAARGVDANARIARVEEVVQVERGRSWNPYRLAHRLRVAMRRRINAAVDIDAARFIHTAVLGDRTASGEAVELGFKAAGATHALSVSGLHLAIIAALCFFAVRTAVGRIPWLALRLNAAAVAAALSIPVVGFYTLLTGSAVATCRSALMASVLFGASCVCRPFSLACSMALAALVLLWQSPLWLMDVSFQLSFISVAALTLFANALAPPPDFADGSRLRRTVAWLWRLIAASLAAGLVTAPLVAHHFGEVTPAAPIGNLVLTPQVELLVVPLGLFGAVFALIHPMLGFIPLTLAGWASHLVLFTAEVFRQAAPIWRTSRPGWFVTVTMTLSLATALAALTLRKQKSETPGRSVGIRAALWKASLIACVAATVAIVGAEVMLRMRDHVTITFIDVGQGDAALVEGPGTFVALVDGGGLVNSDFDVGKRVLEPLLRQHGIDRLDLIALSHPHPDHMQGLFAVMQRFDVATLWTSGDRGDNPEYDRLLALAHSRGTQTPRPETLQRAGLVLQPVGPWLDDRIAAAPGLGVNDNSLTIRLEYRGRSVLFAGDIEEDAELEMNARADGPGPVRVRIQSDVLKVPHHCSRTSSSPELLDVVQPRLAVASLGHENRFGFPHAEVVERYGARKIELLRTDLCGAIQLKLTRSGGMNATTFRSCR